VVVFSDGVSEALNAAGEEFGDDRLLAAAHQAARDADDVTSPRACGIDRQRRAGRSRRKRRRATDITAMVIRYLGAGA
jgi:serine phosphatase RsbU (regulator of sigma subunit)